VLPRPCRSAKRALVADLLRGTTSVSRVDGAAYAFRIERAGADPLLVAWDVRDPFDGEDEPPIDVTLPWDATGAAALDAFGRSVTSTVDNGRVALSLSDTPVFVRAAKA
jgi:hypothetical protein